MTYKTFPDSDPSDSGEDNYVLSSMVKRPNRKGYSVVTAATFITSLMAGMGVLALPHAMGGTGWYGLLLIVLASVDSCYCALLLGRIWLTLEERWSEYRDKFRSPYPAMGLRAVGPWMRYVVSATLQLTLLGVATVYILLSTQIAQSLTHKLFEMSHTCWLLIIALVLCPLTWFGSIEEFWLAGVGALATAALACYTLLASVLLEIPKVKSIKPAHPDFTSFSLAFGTILFSFGGVFAFPTIQNDMASRKRFPRATFIGFAGLLLLYLPVTLSAHAVLGSDVPSNILLAISPGFLRTLTETCLATHILLAYLLIINPVAQEIEEALGVEPTFSYKRCLVRTVIMAAVLLIAYAVPHFDKILNLIGGSTMTLLTFIFPPLFYLSLEKDKKDGKISQTEKIFLFQVIAVGIAGGISSTYFAFVDIVSVFVNNEPHTMSIS